MASDYESVLLVKNEVFIYKIPPLTTNKGYKASDWKLDAPDWTGRMKVIARGNDCLLKLEDKNSGELFAKCPIDKYPSVCVESVTDSSRYFVIRLMDDDGRSAFIGMGFADRSDSFDLNVTLQDHFKWVEKNQAPSEEEDQTPALDLGFKEGQTIKINVNFGKKSGGGRERTKAKAGGAGGGGILLPPPPGGVKLLPPVKPQTSTTQPSELLDIAAPSAQSGSSSQPAAAAAGDNWIQF